MLRKLFGALGIVAACSGALAAQPRSGIDIAAIDPTVRPQQDFWQFANGKWLAATSIPADRAAWDSFAALRETTQQQLRDVIEGIDPHSSDGSEPRQLADLYGSFMDEARVEAAGLDGLQDELRRIHGVDDKAALPALFAQLSRLWVRIPWGLEIRPDEHDATTYVAHLEQGRLGLPDRDYYLKDDAHFQAIRGAYRDHIAKLLSLAGEPAAEANAEAIIALETTLARLQWTRVENRDPLKTYTKREIAALPALTAPADWPSYLAASGVGPEIHSVIVAQPSYFDGVGGIVRDVPLATWRAYLAYNLLSAYAPYLSTRFADEDFAFEQHVLRGVPEDQPRWKRAVSLVDRAFRFALGRLYVARYFPPAAKQRADTMVANLIAAYRESIATLDWMGEQTRRQALQKLAAIRPMVGYPATWRDYSGLVVRRDDLVGNVMRARGFDYDFWLAKLGHVVDRAEWFTAPQTVNAFYSPNRNQIVFPAGILQPPFFDAGADDASNYGGIGAVIGHEISHAFDDQGSRFDGEGNLRNWWTDEDRSRFDAKTRSLVAQYDAFSPLPGYHVNGALTLGENVADNAGLAIVERAYRLSLGGCSAPMIDGYTGAQRLFISFAQIWRDKVRDAFRIERLKVDPHSPGQFRADGALRNQNAFVDAFAVQPGDAMYLPPEQRISLWQVDREIVCKAR
ncbi:MAG TPA: M13 family metallopeptidase [Bradyrhizobium sp.]|jgi:predicted metalloendopeptidase